MRRTISRVCRFLHGSDGPTAVEYAVLLSLLFLTATATVQSLSTVFDSPSESLQSSLDGQGSGGSNSSSGTGSNSGSEGSSNSSGGAASAGSNGKGASNSNASKGKSQGNGKAGQNGNGSPKK